jgi:lysophospholipase L1-like esterase
MLAPGRKGDYSNRVHAVQHPLRNKTTLALATMLVLLAIPYASPRLRALRVADAPWDRRDAEESEVPGTPGPNTPPTAFAEGEQTLKATANEGTVTNALPASAVGAREATEALDPAVLAKLSGSLAVEDPTGHALDPFYAALARSLKREPGAITRILHYGDSVIAGDLVSGTMRRRMQERFGDAGHGFILIANPWEWYFQNDIAHTASEGWNASKLTGPWPDDKMFGLGSVSFHTGAIASAWFSTMGHGEYGRKVSRFDLYYLEQPRGGDVMLTATGKPAERLSTRGETKVSRVKSIAVEDGAASLTVRTLGNGDVRVFGVALERDEPGVTYDALGAHAARASFWNAMDVQHWADQIALRKPSLIVLQYGTNESEDTTIKAETYEPVFGALIDKVKQVAPGIPILVLSPLDRAIKADNGDLKTSPVIKRIIAGQRAATLARGCAFWSTFDAMGGEGTMAKWRHTRPQLGNNDLSHPTPAGAEIIGDLYFKAIRSGYEAYASTHPDAPKLPADAKPDPRPDPQKEDTR